MIDSSQNKNIKLLNSLKIKKERDKNKLFVVEGLRFVSEIPIDYEVEFYCVSEDFAREFNISGFEKRAAAHVVSKKVFKEVSDTENPQGILAVVKQKNDDLKKVLERTGEKGFFVIVEELNDPGNLGTIIRTADSSGVDCVIVSKGSADIYNSKVLRSTMGSIFHLPIIYDANIEESIDLLKSHGISVYAAHLEGEKYPYGFDFKKGCCFLIGNEARGLSEKVSKKADEFIKIPIIGKAESLNASIAAGILMYEAVRQRLIK